MRGKGTVSQPSAQHGENVSEEKLSQRWYQRMFQNKTRASDQTYYDVEKTDNSLNMCERGPQVKRVRGRCRVCLTPDKVLGGERLPQDKILGR